MANRINSHAARLDRRNQGAPWRGPTCPTYQTSGRGRISALLVHFRARPAALSAFSSIWPDWLGRLDTALKINGLLRPTWSGACGRLASFRDNARKCERIPAIQMLPAHRPTPLRRNDHAVCQTFLR